MTARVSLLCGVVHSSELLLRDGMLVYTCLCRCDRAAQRRQDLHVAAVGLVPNHRS